MAVVKGFCIIFFALWGGELLSILLPFPMSGNIYGMVLLFTALMTGLVALDDVEEAGDLLLDHLVLLFIPVGVGMIGFRDLLIQELLSVVVVGAGGFAILFWLVSTVVDTVTRGED